jgi:hypothetical protein
LSDFIGRDTNILKHCLAVIMTMSRNVIMKNKKHTRKTNIFVLLFSSFISIIMCFTFLSPFYGNIASTFNNCAGFGTSLQAIKVTGQKSGLFETQRFSSTSTNIMPEQKSYSSSYGDQPQPFTH